MQDPSQLEYRGMRLTSYDAADGIELSQEYVCQTDVILSVLHAQNADNE